MFKSISNFITDRALNWRMKSLMKSLDDPEMFKFEYKDKSKERFASTQYRRAVLSELMILQDGSVDKTRDCMRDIAGYLLDKSNKDRDPETGYSTGDKYIDIYKSVFSVIKYNKQGECERVCYIFTDRPGLIIGESAENINALEKEIGMKIVMIEDLYSVERDYCEFKEWV